MKSFAEYLAEEAAQVGTYAAVKFDPDSIHKLNQYINQHGIPNPVPPEKFHSTLMYSRKKCEGITADPTACYKGKVSGLEVWPNRDGERALVAKMESPELAARHQHLMDKHDATWDHPDFKPHVTLSYNIGDFDHTKLPPFEHELNMNNEYTEDLNLKWKDK